VGECAPNSRQIANEHYERGYRLYKAGKWELALQEAKLCLSYDPLNRKFSRLFTKVAAHKIATHYKQIGEELKAQGRFAEVIEGYQKVLQLKIQRRTFRRLIKSAKRQQRQFQATYTEAKELFNQEKYTKAKRKALSLLKQAPYSEMAKSLLADIERWEQAQELYTQGARLYREGNYGGACEKLEQSIALEGSFSASKMLLDKVKQQQIKEEYGLVASEEGEKRLEESVLLLEEAAEVPLEHEPQGDDAQGNS